MLPYRSRHTLRVEDYRVEGSHHPDWVSGTTRLPRMGEEIFCAGGLGIVTGLGGKTGDGSRLVHIKLPEAGRRVYFAAASNVLLPPAGRDVPDAGGPERALGGTPTTGVEVWFGVSTLVDTGGGTDAGRP